jgi:hypothetical protein
MLLLNNYKINLTKYIYINYTHLKFLRINASQLMQYIFALLIYFRTVFIL